MRILGWVLYCFAIARLISNGYNVALGKDADTIEISFWRAIVTIPTIIFFILYLY